MATLSMNSERLDKAFEHFETQRTILTDCTVFWKDLSTHFTSLQQDISHKSQTLDTKLQTLDSKTKQTLESLDQREQSIPSKEEETLTLTLIDQKKESVVAEIEEDNGNPILDPNDLAANLRSICRRMDTRGLVRFLVLRRKEVLILRTEVPKALPEAVDPATLVLQAVEDLVFRRSSKSGGVSDQRWACGLLLRALAEIGGDLPESGRRAFAGSVVERARAVAKPWKLNIDEAGEVKDANAVEVQTFLQHLVTFGIGSEFEREWLRKMVVAFSTRRDMPKIGIALGFKEEMGDIIEGLINSGKELDAVYFAFGSGLTERFPAVPLLKTHLTNIRKQASSMLRKNPNAVDEVNAFEMSSLKSMIWCVEEHKLESEFSIEIHKKRISDLEKAKFERKKTTGPAKSQNKRSRASGGGGGAASAFRPAKAGRVANAYGSIRRNPAPTSYPAPYNYPVQGGREPAPASAVALGPYTSAHVGAARNPAPVQQHYQYMQPESSGPTYGAAPSYSAGYEYGSGLAAPYQSSYTH